MAGTTGEKVCIKSTYRDVMHLPEKVRGGEKKNAETRQSIVFLDLMGVKGAEQAGW